MRWLTLIVHLWLLRSRILAAAGLTRPSLINVHESADARRLDFQLRHLHGVNKETQALVLKDRPHNDPSLQSFTLRTKRAVVYRPKSGNTRLGPWSAPIDWDEDELVGPDVTDRDTLLTLAKMTSDAYYDSPGTGKSGWYELGDKWNISYPFGWEPDENGFRGHVFATLDNSTVVLAIKGTSVPWIVDNGPTAKKDKLNDNLLWSCCCARVDWTWTPVCDCYSGSNQCDTNCLEDALIEESLFYTVALNLYYNITYMYPHSNIWLTGHSLGGGIAALLGASFGIPVVAFESPGDKFAAQRLHLPSPPSTHHITHVYHNADPVPIGACTGITSSCYLGGYALETRCHLGKSIVYDTVNGEQWKWSVNVQNHGINVLIDSVLDKNVSVPEPRPETDCVECYPWEYGDFFNTSAAHRGTLDKP